MSRVGQHPPGLVDRDVLSRTVRDGRAQSEKFTQIRSPRPLRHILLKRFRQRHPEGRQEFHVLQNNVRSTGSHHIDRVGGLIATLEKFLESPKQHSVRYVLIRLTKSLHETRLVANKTASVP